MTMDFVGSHASMSLHDNEVNLVVASKSADFVNGIPDLGLCRELNRLLLKKILERQQRLLAQLVHFLVHRFCIVAGKRAKIDDAEEVEERIREQRRRVLDNVLHDFRVINDYEDLLEHSSSPLAQAIPGVSTSLRFVRILDMSGQIASSVSPLQRTPVRNRMPARNVTLQGVSCGAV
jgi:hypothetical protein